MCYILYMSQVKHLAQVAGQLYLVHDDGFKQLMYPATSGIWLPAKDSRVPPEPEPPVDPEPGDPGPVTGGWTHPLPEGSVTSGYGPRGGVLHAGVDLSSVGGMAPGNLVRACTAMRITVAYEAGSGGLYDAGTYVKGHSLQGAPYTFNHFHGVQGSLQVSVGDVVQPGQPLMREGATGNITGTHLHLEIWPGHVGPDSVAGLGGPWYWGDGTPVDPLPILRANGVNI